LASDLHNGKPSGCSVNPQPLIAVRDVEASSLWYQAVLGFTSGHGGPEYEQLVSDGRMVMQLHHWDTQEHPHLGDPESQPYGNGVVLWFQTNHFDEALRRIQVHGAHVIEGPEINPNANHREIWLRDPDGYVVVVAGPYGDVGRL
jgi:catechol 2,3-dioxygenase-like lactoylglutathione lyase family enzyme